jgi:1-acyl-sn-glycerol-3-phosphate acyltransferase
MKRHFIDVFIRLITLIFWALLGVIFLLILKIIYKKHYHFIIKLWSKCLLKIAGIKIIKQGNVLNGGKILFVSNHVSLFDIPVIHSIINGNFISKAEVNNWPIIGFLSRNAGTHFINRRNVNKSLINSMLNIEQLLSNGERLILFPEGTTSLNDSIKNFNSLFFQSAINSESRIQAMKITYIYNHNLYDDIAYVENVSFFDVIKASLIINGIEAKIEFFPYILAKDLTRKKLAKKLFNIISKS